jgi:chromosome segregation ATPase
VETAAIAREIAELERELSNLRARADEDKSSFAALEHEIAELRESLTQTHDTVRMHELRLAEKQVALKEAQRLERLESYENDLADYRAARARVSEAASTFLAEVEAYDDKAIKLGKLLDEMREAFGLDERVAKVETALAAEAAELSDSCRAVVDASTRRISQLVEMHEDDAAASSAGVTDLPEDLQDIARERRTARILEYFSKS